MAKRCDLCGAVLTDREVKRVEEAGLEEELCQDCLHGGYGVLGRMLRGLKGKARRTKDRMDDAGE